MRIQNTEYRSGWRIFVIHCDGNGIQKNKVAARFFFSCHWRHGSIAELHYRIVFINAFLLRHRRSTVAPVSIPGGFRRAPRWVAVIRIPVLRRPPPTECVIRGYSSQRRYALQHPS